MKTIACILPVILMCIQNIQCQEIPATAEQQLEGLAEADEMEKEDDSYFLALDQYRKRPLNLNTADANELRTLSILNELQVNNLLYYRKLLGPLISVYELQAIPAWDLPMIRILVPFITIGTALIPREDMRKRLQNGEHSLLFRISGVLEKSKGFNRSILPTAYLGDPQRLYIRYRYNYKGLVQFGMVADKDAGEPFFKNAQKAGFDFYSFHAFIKKVSIIESLALGDYTVNMGQGLIQWQGQAFGKSAATMGVKRQSAILCPYSSAGEYNFSRGAGITIKKKNIEATLFASIRQISANLDTVAFPVITSLLTSGLHRTFSEINNRNNIRQFSAGGSLIYKAANWQIGANIISHRFSLPVQKRDEPYNFFAINGDHWYNLSIDYGYTHKNVHLFGEAAVDREMNKAFVNGIMLSIDPRVDLSLVQRAIDKDYQAVNGNAFTENTAPANETGYYTGITVRPVDNWRIDAYADIYKFYWLKYLVDAPSAGRDYLVRATYTINKKGEIYTLFRDRSRQGNQPDNITPVNELMQIPQKNWRIHFGYKINSSVTVRSRVEMKWYNKKGMNAENGFLLYFDFLYKPMLKRYSLVLRAQYFETDDYNSRIYAYENDILYSYSVPAFFKKGYRYYMLLNMDISKKISCGMRWAQTKYLNLNSIGSGLDEIPGNKKTEIKLQLKYVLKNTPVAK